MRQLRIMTVPAIHHETPLISRVFENDYSCIRKAKTTRESSGNMSFVDIYRIYSVADYQKITATFPETKILYDNTTKPEPPAPGLQKSHDIAPIVALNFSNALQPPEVIEHKATHIEKEQEWIKLNPSKSDKFMWIFRSCTQAEKTTQ
ncbi:MAG: hypothetical protein K9H16_01090 [Bacteroidales bacterium]|nr:hypothetical protein [Bacteroidales bacterium]